MKWTYFRGLGHCLQAGSPILLNGYNVLEKGRNAGYITKEKHRQSFICKNSKNNFVMGLAENVKLISFVDTLALDESNGGIGCIDALLLTSKGISGIYSNLSSPNPAIGNTKVPLPNAIIIK